MRVAVGGGLAVLVFEGAGGGEVGLVLGSVGVLGREYFVVMRVCRGS